MHEMPPDGHSQGAASRGAVLAIGDALQSAVPVGQATSPHAQADGTRPQLYYPALDGLRFMAFMLVFVHHLPVPTNPVLRLLHLHGWVGVHLFLFLSAYLLTSILGSEHALMGRIFTFNFYARRALRIWPLYFTFCLAVLAYELLLHPERRIDWTGFWGLTFFVDNLLAGWRGYNQLPFAGHLWTISLEEQFYAVLPFLLAGFLASRRTLLRGILAFWLLFLTIRTIAVIFGARHPVLWTSIFSADALLLGTLLGALQPAAIQRPVPRLAIILGGTAALFSPALMPPVQIPGVQQILLYAFIGAGAGAWTLAALHEPALAFLGTPVFRYLGKISYGLYVFHLLGIAIGTKLAVSISGVSSNALSWWIIAATSLAATVILAATSYQFLERKFLRFKRSFETVRSRPV